jgi:hypothetical protein
MAADKTLPCWSFRPDWKDGILEALEWKTSVATSPKGAEQRRALRLSPRRHVEFQCLGVGNERSHLDLAVWAAGASRWNLPLWWDSNPMTEAGSPGDTVLHVNTDYTEFEVDGLAFIQGADAQTFEVVEVAFLGGSTMTIKAPGLAKPWPAKTKVFPIKQAQFEDQPQDVRRNDNVSTFQCSFVVTETNDHSAVAPAEAYLGYKVYRKPSNENGALTRQWSRILAEFDNGMSLPYRVDTALYAVERRQHEIWTIGRQEQKELRDLLYWARGRARPVWVPTFFIDMRPTADIGASDTTITIEKVGVSQYVNMAVDSTHPEHQYPGRRDLCIALRDGGVLFTRINAAVDNLDGTETLTLAADLGVPVAVSSIKRVSFMTLMRLDQDRVEINHQTDNTGVATSVVSFITTPENRQILALDQPAWEGAMLSGTCGNICAPILRSARAYDLNFEGDFNPVTREIWAGSNSGSVIAYRYSTSALDALGTITGGPSNFTIFGAPAFTYDSFRSAMLCFGIDAVLNHMWVLKIDAATGTVLASRDLTADGIGYNNSSGRIRVLGDGTIVMIASVVADTRFYTLDPSTMAATLVYTYSNRLFSGFSVIGTDGKLYFTAPNGTPTSSTYINQLLVFDGATVAVAATNANGIARLLADPGRGSIWAYENSGSPRYMAEWNIGSAFWTGRRFPVPATFDNILFDARNDVIWGQSMDTVHFVDQMVGLNASDGSTFGTFDYFVNSMATGFTEVGLPPGTLRPNALYMQTQGYDPTDPIQPFFSYILKLPVCNARKP